MARRKNRYNGVYNTKEVEKEESVSYRVALYARISVDANERKRESIETQLDIMKDYITEHPELGSYLEYVDRGFSGTSFERPAFNLMMDDVRSGKINCIMVKDLSRFGRNYLETTNYIETILPFMGVRLISVNDRFDTEDRKCQGKDLEVTIKNLANDMYAKDISRKVASAHETNRKRGKWTGGTPPYGYNLNPDQKSGSFVIDEDAANVVRRIFAMAGEGASFWSIATSLQKEGLNTPRIYRRTGHLYHRQGDPDTMWYAATIAGIVHCEAYTGSMVQGKIRGRLYDNEKSHVLDRSEWTIVENAHEPLVSKDVFDRIQLMAKDRYAKTSLSSSGGTTASKKKNKYAGVIFCGECGRTLRYHSSYSRHKDGTKKRCYGFACVHGVMHSDGKSVNFSEAKLDETVLAAIRNHVKSLKDNNVTIETHKKRIECRVEESKKAAGKLETEIGVLRRELFLLHQSFGSGEISRIQYQHDRQEVLDRISGLNDRLGRALDDAAAARRGGRESLRMLKALFRANGSAKVSGEMVETLISRIAIRRGGFVEIEWRFADEEFSDVSSGVKGGRPDQG